MNNNKPTKRTFGQEIIARLQEFTEDIESGMDLAKKYRITRLYFDFTPQPYNAAKVKKTRKLLTMEPRTFAQFLGVSLRTVQAWEKGISTPNEMACRFMDEIHHDPEYWRRRYREATVRQ